MRYSVLFFYLIISMLSGCDKAADPVPVRSYPDQDLGIRFALYQEGQIYQEDTLRNHLVIKNYGPETLQKGDTIKAACLIGGVVWAFDLMSAGPTPVVLEKTLEVGGEIEINPGYLYGPDILDYFKTGNVDICVLVYGVNNAVTDLTFGSDPQKENNRQCINYSSSGEIKLN